MLVQTTKLLDIKILNTSQSTYLSCLLLRIAYNLLNFFFCCLIFTSQIGKKKSNGKPARRSIAEQKEEEGTTEPQKGRKKSMRCR